MLQFVSNIIDYKRNNPLAYRLMSYILLCSLFFTILTTLFQLYLDYQKDIGLIEERVQQIRDSYLQGIAKSLWDFNTNLINIQLRGILQLPDIQYLEIHQEQGPSQQTFQMGRPMTESTRSYKFSLEHRYKGKSYHLGTLSLIVTLEGVHQRLRERALIILVTQAIQIFLISTFILFIFQHIVTRHLNTMAQYAKQIDLNNLSLPLTLKRPPLKEEPDELERVVTAINDMRINLQQDIIERKQAEEALRKSEKRYRLLAENATDMISKHTPGGMYLYASPTCHSLLGYTFNELVGHESYEFLHPEDIEAVRLSHSTILNLPDVYTVSYRIRRKNGNYLWVESKSKTIRDPETGDVQEIIAVTRDISERKLAEDVLKKTQNYLVNILNSSPSAIIGINSQGIITAFNSTAEKLSAIPSNEAKGKVFAEVLPLYKEYLEYVKQVIREKKPLTKEKIQKHYHGQTYYNDISVYPLIADTIEGAVLRIDDVTERAHLEDVIIQTEKMMSVGGLAAGMAHEINNPLGVILQGIQNTLRRLSPELEKNHEVAKKCRTDLTHIRMYLAQRNILQYLDGIRQAGTRASKIVNNMLNFSRRSDSEKLPANINHILEKTIELAANDYELKKKYDFRHIEIIREYDPTLPNVPCTHNEIEQVALNLLRNAAQAIADKGEVGYNPQIIIRTRKDGSYAYVEIEDNGPGMDENTQKHIFEPFYTTKSVGLGTGLGLSVAYFIIINNHKGLISVNSEPGKGTKFTFRLPLREKK